MNRYIRESLYCPAPYIVVYKRCNAVYGAFLFAYRILPLFLRTPLYTHPVSPYTHVNCTCFSVKLSVYSTPVGIVPFCLQALQCSLQVYILLYSSLLFFLFYHGDFCRAKRHRYLRSLQDLCPLSLYATYLHSLISSFVLHTYIVRRGYLCISRYIA